MASSPSVPSAWNHLNTLNFVCVGRAQGARKETWVLVRNPEQAFGRDACDSSKKGPTENTGYETLRFYSFGQCVYPTNPMLSTEFPTPYSLAPQCPGDKTSFTGACRGLCGLASFSPSSKPPATSPSYIHSGPYRFLAAPRPHMTASVFTP